MDYPVAKLQDILDLVGLVAQNKKAPLPTINSVAFGRGEVCGNNLEAAVRVASPQATDEVVIPYQPLMNIVKFLSKTATVSITPEQGRVQVVSGRTQATIMGCARLEDFPPIPSVEGVESEINGDRLVQGMEMVLPFAATDDKARPVLAGVCVRTLGEGVQVAAADGFRLAFQSVEVPLAFPEGCAQVVIPRAGVDLLGKMWKLAPKTLGSPAAPLPSVTEGPSVALAAIPLAPRVLRVNLTEERLQVTSGPVSLSVLLVQGAYPNYMSLVPTDPPSHMTAHAEDLLHAVNQVSHIARGASNLVRLLWEDGRLVVSAQSADIGLVTYNMVAGTEGPRGRIAFRLPYLRDYLKDKEGPVSLSVDAPSSPGLFTFRGTPNVVIMPMQARWDDEPEAQSAPAHEAGPGEAQVPAADDADQDSDEAEPADGQDDDEDLTGE